MARRRANRPRAITRIFLAQAAYSHGTLYRKKLSFRSAEAVRALEREVLLHRDSLLETEEYIVILTGDGDLQRINEPIGHFTPFETAKALKILRKRLSQRIAGHRGVIRIRASAFPNGGIPQAVIDEIAQRGFQLFTRNGYYVIVCSQHLEWIIREGIHVRQPELPLLEPETEEEGADAA